MNNEKFEYVYGYNIENEYPRVKITIERITPEVARKMLETNIENRPKKREPIAHAIKNGEWMLNGETIAFSWDGVLRDGQNRLMAIVEAGLPADTVVVRGVDPESQKTMDSGVKRQVGDFLKMAGYKNYTKVATIGMALCRADARGLDTFYSRAGNGDQPFTTTGYLDYIEKNYTSRIEPIVNISMNAASQFRSVRLGTLAPLVDAFMQVDIDSANDFMKQVSGEKTQCQPVQKLVQRLYETGKNKQTSVTQTTIAAWIIKTWNAYMQGDELTFLRYTRGGASKEQFPQIYGLNGEL